MVVLTEFEEAVGPGAFRIVDHWETDRMAIRIAHPNDEHLLAYVALGNADGRYVKWTPLSRPFFARNKLMFGRVVVWVFGWPQHQDHPLPFRRSARRSGRIPAEPYPPSEYLQV